MRRAAALLVVALALFGCEPTPDFDVLIRGGTVFDGTESVGVVADVGIIGSSIARVGDLSDARGVSEVDATGLYVAPGFINLHSHDRLFAVATSENLLDQGVTTILLNADGGGPLDIGLQLAGAERGGLAVNIGAHVGFNRAWGEINGTTDTRPTDAGIEAMNAVVRGGLEAGAWGVSGGLDYKPAYYAQTEEVVRILSGLESYRTLFTNHDRLTPESGYSSMVGMRETIEIGEATGLVPVITHMKIQGREQGSYQEVLAMMDSATARGVYTAADAYPYLAGQTSLAALIIPGWAQEGGVDAMLSRFGDPEQRSRIEQEANEALEARFGGPSGVFLPESQRELTDVMDAYGTSSGGDAVMRLLQAEASTSAILRFGSEEDLGAILSYPSTSIACDCDPTGGPAGHPRYYGTFPRALGRYVRELGVLSWEGAIHRMTGLPAETIGMVDRGYLAPGMAADVVIFDPERVIDHATFTEPTAPSEGMQYVFVNGALVVHDGEVLPSAHGIVLRRERYMPARPPSDGDRVLSLSETSSEGAALEVELAQAAGSPRAGGTLTLELEGVGRIEVEGIGAIQSAEGWAAVTAMAPTPEGEQPLLLVVDSAYPGLDDSTSLVLVTLGGVEVMRMGVPSSGVTIAVE